MIIIYFYKEHKNKVTPFRSLEHAYKKLYYYIHFTKAFHSRYLSSQFNYIFIMHAF